jgi:hypothetical protein
MRQVWGGASNMMCNCHEQYGGTPCRHEADDDDGLCHVCRDAHKEA